MTNYKNDLPLYAEQIIVNQNQEVEQIQTILSQFKQLVPSNFVELEQLNWMCYTQGWKEPACERFNCLINGEWKQVDISHALLEKLELTKNIPYPVYISSTVLNKGLDRYFAYNVEGEKDIFLQKPFTIQNLNQNLNNLFQQIEELERENQENQKTIKDLEKTKSDWKNEWLTEWRKNRTLSTEKNNLQQSLSNSQNYLKSSLINSLFKNKRIRELSNCLSFLRSLLVNQNQEVTNLTTRRNNLQTQLNQTQTERDDFQNQVNDLNQQLTDANNLITNLQNLLGINNLDNLPALPYGETLVSLLARPTLTQLIDLIREKDQALTTKNTQIANLTQQVNAWNNCFPFANGNPSLVKAEIDNFKNELQKEKDWWDKWTNDNTKKLLPSRGSSAEFNFPDGTRFSYYIIPQFDAKFKINIKKFYQYYRDQ